ncbi:MAG: Bro-N domain-containing protein [Candidatus Cryosericum sp.]
MSNTELQLFQFGTSPVHTVMVNGEPWFVARGISDVLEFGDTTHALRGLEDSEKGLHIVETPGGNQSMTGSEKGTHIVGTLGTRSEKGSSIVATLGETQSIQELESSAKGERKAPTLGTTQSIQRLEDLEKGMYSIPTLGENQSLAIVSKSGTEDTT